MEVVPDEVDFCDNCNWSYWEICQKVLATNVDCAVNFSGYLKVGALLLVGLLLF